MQSKSTTTNAPRLLIIENELVIGAYIAAAFEADGWQTIGPFGRLGEAQRTAYSADFDAAVLNIHLERGEVSAPIAHILQRRRTPFVFVSGESSIFERRGFEAVPFLPKPFVSNSLVAMITQALLDSGRNLRAPS